MRLVLSITILFAAAAPLAAQEDFRVQADPRLPITSCPAADSILGDLSKDERKAEVHGTVGPGQDYQLTTGPQVLSGGRTSVLVTSYVKPRGLLPAGYITGYFPSSVLKPSHDQVEPMVLVLGDTMQVPLSTPHPTKVTGMMPPMLPFTALLRQEDMQLLLESSSAKLTWLGKTAKIERAVIVETRAAARLATCQLAATPQAGQ